MPPPESLYEMKGQRNRENFGGLFRNSNKIFCVDFALQMWCDPSCMRTELATPCSCLHRASSSRHCRRSLPKQHLLCSSLMASRPVHVQPLLRFGQNTSGKEKNNLNRIRNQDNLVAQPLHPAYRTIGYGYTYRTYVFRVSQAIALYPPKLS